GKSALCQKADSYTVAKKHLLSSHLIGAGDEPKQRSEADYNQPIPASGSTQIAARQTSTTSILRRFAKRPSLTKLSMAQKQIAPITQIIKISIKTESIATPCAGE